jgi:hypothetical protein
MCKFGFKSSTNAEFERKAKIYVGVFGMVENTFEEWETGNLRLANETSACKEHN